MTIGEMQKNWHNLGRAVGLAPRLPGFDAILGEGDGVTHGITFVRFDLSRLRLARQTSKWLPAKELRLSH